MGSVYFLNEKDLKYCSFSTTTEIIIPDGSILDFIEQILDCDFINLTSFVFKGYKADNLDNFITRHSRTLRKICISFYEKPISLDNLNCIRVLYAAGMDFQSDQLIQFLQRNKTTIRQLIVKNKFNEIYFEYIYKCLLLHHIQFNSLRLVGTEQQLEDRFHNTLLFCMIRNRDPTIKSVITRDLLKKIIELCGTK